MRLNPIDKAEAARYMGIKGEPEPQLSHIIDRAELLVRTNIEARYVFREAPLNFVQDGVKIAGIPKAFGGRDIASHLSGCTRAVVLAATLTSAADKLIRQARLTSMADALAVDCICSAAIEQVCDRAEEEIFSQIEAPFRTWRFSPGYGDFLIQAQRDVLEFLNAARRIGLTVTENSVLIPSKSVTAIIGIADSSLRKGAKGCAVCSMRESCAYRSNGGCGSRT